jgi:molybdate transport system substrate-binding protein
MTIAKFIFQRIVLSGLLLLLTASFMEAKEPPLLVFAGAASKPPLEELAQRYEQRTGQKVEVVFGGSGYVLSQMKLARRGDVYFPGSSDFMEVAKRQGLVFPETERKVVFLVPAINVQAGNPKGIRGLKDLLKPGIRVVIANPENVCVGTYAVEIVEANLNPEERIQFRKNLINYTESCEKTATAVSLKAVDAVIGWSVFEHWDPTRIQTIPLPANQVRRVGYIPLAIATFSKRRDLAQRFIDFVLSPEGKAAFARYHYFATPEEAFAFIGQSKPVGGEYALSRTWIDGSR